MVFVAPNKGAKTKNTTNTRSELRHMLRGTKTKYKTHSGPNNFAIRARKDSDKFGRIGGRLEATLKVDHVALNAGRPDTKAAYSAVVGQIHAVKYGSTKSGFGYGNEPLKIYYKNSRAMKKGLSFGIMNAILPKTIRTARIFLIPFGAIHGKIKLTQEMPASR